MQIKKRLVNKVIKRHSSFDARDWNSCEQFLISKGGYLSQKTQEIKEKKIVYINPWEKYSDPMRKYDLAFL
jgi:hypothetical protein